MKNTKSNAWNEKEIQEDLPVISDEAKKLISKMIRMYQNKSGTARSKEL